MLGDAIPVRENSVKTITKQSFFINTPNTVTEY